MARRSAKPVEELRYGEVDASHRPAILRYLQRLTRHASLAEDLTQETFLRVSRALPEFRGDSKLTTWLYRIATNVYLDHVRREATRRRSERDAGAPPASGAPRVTSPGTGMGEEPADRLFEDSEMASCIRELVDELPPDHRAAVVLHDLEGLANPEVARVLGCSVDTVKIRVHRGRGKLRALLDEHCELSHTEEGVLHCDRRQPDEHRR